MTSITTLEIATREFYAQGNEDVTPMELAAKFYAEDNTIDFEEVLAMIEPIRCQCFFNGNAAVVIKVETVWNVTNTAVPTKNTKTVVTISKCGKDFRFNGTLAQAKAKYPNATVDNNGKKQINISINLY